MNDSAKSPLYSHAEKLLIDHFKAEKATNYVGHVIEDEDTGELYEIIMQRIGGETPAQQLQVAKEKIAQLEMELEMKKFV